jgi:hypothetical protein
MLKSRCRAIIFGLVLSTPAGAALAQEQSAPAPTDLIAALNSICVAAQGDRAQVATLAAEQGFSPMPDSMLPRRRNSSGGAGFMRTNATDASIVVTGAMTRRIKGKTVVMDFCSVSAQPADHRALDVRLRQVIGFPPVDAAGLEAYAWLQTPEGRAPSRGLNDDQFIAMAQTGQMRMVGLDRVGRGASLLYILPRIDQ